MRMLASTLVARGSTLPLGLLLLPGLPLLTRDTIGVM